MAAASRASREGRRRAMMSTSTPKRTRSVAVATADMTDQASTTGAWSR
jgi:hypothetical protein